MVGVSKFATGDTIRCSSETTRDIVRRITEVRPTGYTWVYVRAGVPDSHVDYASENSTDPQFADWELVLPGGDGTLGRKPWLSTGAALTNEVGRARAKFPSNEKLLAALMEEVGELAQAMLQRKPLAEIRKEALQVACVAVRIYGEGDSDFDGDGWKATP